ncbi:hypothetical protein BC477_17255 [Clavibacter michiganensis subsp. michiganensis]|uniref:Periplasmic copper-binding protein NosD beta helix domain-containing protein n=1 Tax=Clavibacter michiganensis subsp. michiganensis TaxID=33013 RepID=A0A251XDE1_CLAMM|nr:hypothetical protein BC477_17255 [Clavibacter michiganensis subsp. michiganensis]OUE00345.1 hypothetical protein CMMCAS07_18245 [Clavibacter michiganensis subsp. michiganensis]
MDVIDSAFLRSAGNGLWFDESIYDATVAGNDVLANTGNGVVFELSAQLAFVDNVAAGNGAAGLWIDDSGHAQVWANTFSGNRRDVDIAQGSRRAANLGEAGHDPRQQLPDPTVTWIVTDIQVADNVMQGSTGNALLAVEDHSHERSATQMGITTAGNVYQRDVASSPRWAIVWARAPATRPSTTRSGRSPRPRGTTARASTSWGGRCSDPAGGSRARCRRSRPRSPSRCPPRSRRCAGGHRRPRDRRDGRLRTAGPRSGDRGTGDGGHGRGPCPGGAGGGADGVRPAVAARGRGGHPTGSGGHPSPEGGGATGTGCV